MAKVGNGHPKGKLYYFYHNYARKLAKLKGAHENTNGIPVHTDEEENTYSSTHTENDGMLNNTHTYTYTHICE